MKHHLKSNSFAAKHLVLGKCVRFQRMGLSSLSNRVNNINDWVLDFLKTSSYSHVVKLTSKHDFVHPAFMSFCFHIQKKRGSPSNQIPTIWGHICKKCFPLFSPSILGGFRYIPLFLVQQPYIPVPWSHLVVDWW